MRIYSQDIGMDVNIERCVMLILRNGKQEMREGIELPIQVNIKTLGENKTYKYFGILEADTIKQVEMKEKNLKTVSQGNKKTCRNQTI